MKCPNPNCNRSVQPDWKTCPYCSTPINPDSGITPPGGIIDSVVKADTVHVGDKHIHEAPDPSARQQATYTGMLCPICHRLVAGTDWFECQECKRKYIHIAHQDKNSYACSECAAKAKGESIRTSSEVGIGAVIADRYELKSVVGEGGMGTVFAAIDQKLGRNVAIKCLSGESREEQKGIERFLQEAKSIALLSHMNIVMVYDVSKEEEIPYICMELLEGKTLEHLIKEKSQLTLEEVFPIVKGVGQALSYAHKRQVIHRDIKPSNILLTNDNIIKILDFGLARIGQSSDLSKTGYGIGTELYASPEQRRDAKHVDYRTDIYSFGATVYELLTNESPMAPREDRLPKEVASVIMKAMEPSIEKRYFTIDDFVGAFEKAIDSPEIAPPKLSESFEGQCVECGFNNTTEARFCESCGAGLYEKCPKCSKEFRIGKTYCPLCGVEIESFKKFSDYLKRGKEFLQSHRYSRAIKEFELSLQKYSSSEEAKKLLQESQQKQDKLTKLLERAKQESLDERYEVADDLLRKALELTPDSSEINSLLAEIPEKIKQRDFRNFEDKWTELMESEKCEEAIQLAETFRDDSDNDQIDDYINSAKLGLNKKKSRENFSLAEESFKKKQYDEALTHLAKAKPHTENGAAVEQLELAIKTAIAKRSKKQNILVLVTSFMILIISIGYTLFEKWQSDKDEEQLYLEACEKADPWFYLQAYGSDSRFSSAIIKLKDSLDEDAYNKISGAGSIIEFEQYLSQFPNGKYTGKVKDRINGIMQKQAEQQKIQNQSIRSMNKARNDAKDARVKLENAKVKSYRGEITNYYNKGCELLIEAENLENRGNYGAAKSKYELAIEQYTLSANILRKAHNRVNTVLIEKEIKINCWYDCLPLVYNDPYFPEYDFHVWAGRKSTPTYYGVQRGYGGELRGSGTWIPQGIKLWIERPSDGQKATIYNCILSSQTTNIKKKLQKDGWSYGTDFVDAHTAIKEKIITSIYPFTFTIQGKYNGIEECHPSSIPEREEYMKRIYMREDSPWTNHHRGQDIPSTLKSITLKFKVELTSDTN